MSFSADRVELARHATTAIIVPEMPRSAGRPAVRDRDGRLAEAVGLATAIGVDIVDTSVVGVRTVNPASLIGKGQIASLAERFAEKRVELVIIDAALSPIQQRNLETAFAAKVIDRTALILEIFGERAVTAEGRLQVELAHLDYQQGRLVRSWTHLERQRGGFGFLGGPGETQIEADRRMIRQRMANIRRNLDDIVRTRALHRQRRQRAPWPVVALVGYTNAGKSTLFNLLSESNVTAQDMLFATLDPTMRKITVDGLGKIILSDTVGFVSDLPTQLVAAFRATLEEVLSADLLLHVRDIHHAESAAQRDDVLRVLGELGIGPMAETPADDASKHDAAGGPPIIEVHNKIDMFDASDRAEQIALSQQQGAVPVSAVSGQGISQLRELLSRQLGGQDIERTITVPFSAGDVIAWLHRNSRLTAETPAPDGLSGIFAIRLSRANSARLDHMLAAAGLGM